MDKPVIRVTQLQVWQECRYRHQLNYIDLLRRLPDPDGGGMSPQVSGSAIHFGIEAALMEPTGRNKLQVAQESALVYLRTRGVDERYAQGARTALEGVPATVWETKQPQSEGRLNVDYGDFILSGQPDLWTYDESSVIITDFKSTSKDEQDRLERLELFNMQPRWYAVLLTDWYRQKGTELPPSYTRHLVLSTRGKHVYGVPKLMTEETISWARLMMLRIGTQVARSADITFLDATVSGSCEWCEYSPICTLHLTGGDWRAIMAEKYRKGDTGNVVSV